MKQTNPFYTTLLAMLVVAVIAVAAVANPEARAADQPIRGVVDSVDVTPGYPYVTVNLKDKRIAARHLMTFEDKEIYCNGKQVDVGQFFTWMFKERGGEVQVVLHPDSQRYGLVPKAEFTRKVRPLPKRAKLTVAPPPRPAVEYGFEYEVPIIAFLAPIPEPVAKRLPVAPEPRAMGTYFDESGTLRTYSREWFDADGVKQMRVHEGDPEFEEGWVPEFRVQPGEMPDI